MATHPQNRIGQVLTASLTGLRTSRLINSLTRSLIRSITACVLVACALMFSTVSQAQPPAWASFLPKADEVGSGQFRWWGFLVYDAKLWSPQGEYQPGGPFALSMTYARSLSGQDIVEASMDQMRDLGLAVDRHPEWRAQLSQVMPSVESGDSLTGVYTPGQGAVFFFNNKLTGQISERLAQAFFAIWLDPNTSEPDLRQALLGDAVKAGESE